MPQALGPSNLALLSLRSHQGPVFDRFATAAHDIAGLAFGATAPSGPTGTNPVAAVRLVLGPEDVAEALALAH